MPGLPTVMIFLIAKVFPKSHKLFLGIREDSTPIVRGFFLCVRLAPSFYFAHSSSDAPHARTSALQQCECFGGRRGEREVESCA